MYGIWAIPTARCLFSSCVENFMTTNDRRDHLFNYAVLVINAERRTPLLITHDYLFKYCTTYSLFKMAISIAEEKFSHISQRMMIKPSSIRTIK